MQRKDAPPRADTVINNLQKVKQGENDVVCFFGFFFPNALQHFAVGRKETT